MFVVLSQATERYFIESKGIRIVEVENSTPAYGVLKEGLLILSINNLSTINYANFSELTNGLKPYQNITIGTNIGTFSLTTTNFTERPGRGRIGIRTSPAYEVKPFGQPLIWLLGLFQLIIALNLGFGAMNLLPAPFFDGGRIFTEIAKEFCPPEKSKAVITYVFAGSVFMLLANLFPTIVTIFGAFGAALGGFVTKLLKI